jgi:hypothetical protein
LMAKLKLGLQPSKYLLHKQLKGHEQKLRLSNPQNRVGAKFDLVHKYIIKRHNNMFELAY